MGAEMQLIINQSFFVASSSIKFPDVHQVMKIYVYKIETVSGRWTYDW